MGKDVIQSVKPLGFPWETSDPFLFCVHHADAYPRGNDEMGPAASLAGRNLGNDFTLKDGWRMYHGQRVPGFPAHPHRGFETVTIVTKGLVDHSDSLGAAGRFGHGDVQWMTAGKGVQHSEMFPLLNREKENPLELFQLWLNLPREKKFAPPHFAMLWNDKIPKIKFKDASGRATTVMLVAGRLEGGVAPAPAPDSWAADPRNEVAIWKISMGENAQWEIPEASPGINRTIYFYEGTGLQVEGQDILPYHAVSLQADQKVKLQNGMLPASLLLLQGRPISEPVVQYGPFVMNTQEEIQQAMHEFRQTNFGGWPWPSHDHVHPRNKGRFALHSNGIEEIKEG